MRHGHTHLQPKIKDLPIKLRNFPRWILLIIIRLYQLLISPILPADSCRFYPTCSHYSFQAIYQYGALRGGWLAVKRLFRCNPFNPGGIDPVP